MFHLEQRRFRSAFMRGFVCEAATASVFVNFEPGENRMSVVAKFETKSDERWSEIRNKIRQSQADWINIVTNFENFTALYIHGSKWKRMQTRAIYSRKLLTNMSIAHFQRLTTSSQLIFPNYGFSVRNSSTIQLSINLMWITTCTMYIDEITTEKAPTIFLAGQSWREM